MKLLICTVGLPRSGKTTWAKTMPNPIVNPDSIRLAIHGQRFHAPAEPFVWYSAHVMVRSLFGAGHDTVIVDACHVSFKRRSEWLSNQWETVFKVLYTPVEVCLTRAHEENDAEIRDVIIRMGREWETLKEGENEYLK